MMEELKKEFEKKFCQKYIKPMKNDFKYLMIEKQPPKKLWKWIEQKIKEAKISENKYWEERLDLKGSKMVSVWADDFLYRIKQLEGE